MTFWTTASSGGNVVVPSISGLNLDLRKGVGLTLQTDGLPTIAEWTSQDANNNVAFQLTKGKQPINKNGYPQFDGGTVATDSDLLTVADGVNFTFTDELSLFFIAKRNLGSVWSGTNVIVNKNGTAANYLYIASVAGGNTSLNIGGDVTVIGSSPVDSEWRVYLGTANSSGVTSTRYATEGSSTINTTAGTWTPASGNIGATADLVIANQANGADGVPIMMPYLMMKAGVFSDEEIGLLMQFGLDTIGGLG